MADYGTSDIIQPWDSALNNISVPDPAIIASGWIFGAVADSPYMNFVNNRADKQINYLMRSGIPEWNSNTPYIVGDWCAVESDIYVCIDATDITGKNPTTNPTKWKLYTADLTPYAPLNSPQFTGIPTAPTASSGTNTTQLATTAFVKDATSIAVPIGTVIAGATNIRADGFLKCNGAAVSRTTYSGLFSVLDTIYGTGDGSTTFNLPDFRGAFLRGVGGTQPHISEVIGKAQGDAIRNITGQLFALDGSYGGAFVLKTRFQTGAGGPEPKEILTFDASQVVPTASENRPYNFAVEYFIKY